MKTTGEFVCHEFRIECPSMGKPIYLIPFGDIHRDCEMFAHDAWREFLSEYKSRRKQCYFICLGDELDFMSSSERRAYEGAGFHESTTAEIEKAQDEKWRKFADEIAWMGDHLIGMHSGNHFFKFSDGTNSTQRICKYLGCKYLGSNSYVGLNIATHGAQRWLYLKNYHGKGGGQLAGSPYNALQKTLLTWKADIIINGHDHSLGSLPSAYMEPIHTIHGMDIEERRILFVRSGSFLKGYEKDRHGYIADVDANPKPLGCPEIEITPQRKVNPRTGVREYKFKLRGIA